MSIDMNWSGGKLLQAALKPMVDGEYVIRPPAGQRLARVHNGWKLAPSQSQNGGYRLSVKGSQRYSLDFT